MKAICLRAGRALAACLLCLAVAGPAAAAAITYRFDTLGDGTVLTDQYAGLHFTNATVLEAGISLNDALFPPRSGNAVLFDDGGPIAVLFDAPVLSVFGYVTYSEGMSMLAYGSTGNLLAAITAHYISNVDGGSGDPGSTPNELLGFASTGELIARVEFRSAQSGNSFTLDDLTVTADAAAVPEPGSLALVLPPLAVLVFMMRRRAGRRRC
ncbi:hypothetical protein IP91_00802 [Pseudoduganella lurida]|uniref:PEP-CTERM sorting domain-containing protein n=1 Tax=Pseudoduganella lurida TaxID=1036180 RepID=A0A562RL13_9BURK|nr:hypothetical protein [Pseudoduganella lurida]TWI69729.1 hypothetical protein IP91_00802 [Pseudoduganella lurida]